MTDSIKCIGIAVVEHEGCYLVGIRGPDVPLAGCAEFPGGKCLPHESPEDCAVRECREESGLLVKVDRLLLQREHSYPHATVDLHFVLCHPTEVACVSNAHHGFRWVPRDQLASLKFPEANEPLLQMLSLTPLPPTDSERGRVSPPVVGSQPFGGVTEEPGADAAPLGMSHAWMLTVTSP